MRIASCITGAALALGLAGAPPASSLQVSSDTLESSSAAVRVRGAGENEVLDAQANRIKISQLLLQVSLQTHRELHGIDHLTRDPEVTVGLEGTNLRDSLRWIGGSVGLRVQLTTTQIRVSEDLRPYPNRSELYDRASSGYFRALVDHPTSQHAATAMWNRARMEGEKPDRKLEAARAFDELVESYPDSDLVPEALLAAGRLFGEAEAWEDAVVRFDLLAARRNHDHGLLARRLLADAHTRVAEVATNPAVRRENAERALHVVDALDDVDATQDPLERKRRYMVRGRAYSLAGDPVKAMKCLDLAERYSSDGGRDAEIARLRALSLEAADRPSEASKAWLFHGSLVDAEARPMSYIRAGRAANRARDYVTTIAIAKAADAQGFGDRVAPLADAALAALGMEPIRLDLFGDPERIQRGIRLSNQGLYDEVILALRPVFDRRATLAPEDRIRLAKTFADSLAREGHIEDARVVLRKAAAEAVLTKTRNEIYVFASELLEREGRLDQAIAALEGRL